MMLGLDDIHDSARANRMLPAERSIEGQVRTDTQPDLDTTLS